MDAIFNCLPLHSVIIANVVISMIGIIFLVGAHTLPRFRKLKLSYVGFWLFLLLYYICRLVLLQDKPRMFALVMSPGHSAFADTNWLCLVVLADFSVIAIIVGTFIHYFKNQRHFFLFATIVILLFITAWISSVMLHHNIVSSLLASAAFLWVGWTCRLKYINNTVVWIVYAILHIPIRLTASDIAPEYVQTVFILLLATKLSVIVAMYTTLEVNVKRTRKKLRQ